jgi:hypothetical protein
MAARERIVVLETPDEREVVVREAAQELESRDCGPERGEERAVAAVLYIPPEHSRAA